MRLLCLTACFLATCSKPALTQTNVEKYRIGEGVLRREATVAVVPQFPSDAAHANVTGVAVGQITFDVFGKPSAIEVVQAPTESIRHAVTTALWRWRLPASKGGGAPASFVSKVTFYFVTKGNQHLVLSPETAGFVGGTPPETIGLQRVR